MDERGVISLFLTVLTLAFMLMAGMVMDSANLRSERRVAADLASQAARAAAQEVDVAHYRLLGRIRLKDAAATAAAVAVVGDSGYEAEVSTSGSRATVKVTREVPAQILGIDGRTRTVSATQTAEAVRGVSSG